MTRSAGSSFPEPSPLSGKPTTWFSTVHAVWSRADCASTLDGYTCMPPSSGRSQKPPRGVARVVLHHSELVPWAITAGVDFPCLHCGQAGPEQPQHRGSTSHCMSQHLCKQRDEFGLLQSRDTAAAASTDPVLQLWRELWAKCCWPCVLPVHLI